jgi:hypothetical protein
MTPGKLAALETEANYPDGVAAKVAAGTLRRIIDERQLLLNACRVALGEIERLGYTRPEIRSGIRSAIILAEED